MSDVTRAFQTLSQEVITTVKDFRESGLTEAAGILEQLQQAEKEKLELTVQWQVLSQQVQDVSEDFGATEHKMKELRKKCVDINELGASYYRLFLPRLSSGSHVTLYVRGIWRMVTS